MQSFSNHRWTQVGRFGALAALLGALAACEDAHASPPGSGPPGSGTPAAPLAVQSVEAHARLLPQEIEVSGTLRAEQQADVAAEAEGLVIEVHAERGLQVRAGDVLARLDPRDAEYALAEAQAAVTQTEERLGLRDGAEFDALATPEVREVAADLERAETEYQRYANLVEEEAVSRSLYDQKRAEFRQSQQRYQAEINRARDLFQELQARRARLDMARKALADTVIRAPWDGCVSEKHATEGQHLLRGAAVATLVKVNPLRVELSIPESAVPGVALGQEVVFAVQSRPGERFTGRIAYVGPALRQDSRSLVVEAQVDNAAGQLLPGMYASARVAAGAPAPSVFVPAAALHEEAGVVRVSVIVDGRAEVRYVQPGQSLEGEREIVRGIEAGERVVVRAAGDLQDGMALVESAGEAL